MIILALGGFVSIFIFWTFLGNILFALKDKTNLGRLLIDKGVFLVFKFLVFTLIVLLSYKYAKPLLEDEVRHFVLWVDPSLSVIFIYLFLYSISGLGNYVQLNLLISYIFKKQSIQFGVVWTMMALLYISLTAIHLKYEHFNKMKVKIEKYQEKSRLESLGLVSS